MIFSSKTVDSPAEHPYLIDFSTKTRNNYIFSVNLPVNSQELILKPEY